MVRKKFVKHQTFWMSGSCLTAAGRWRSVDCADHVFLSLQLPWQQTITVCSGHIFRTIFASFISWYAIAHANSCQSCWHFHPNNFWTSGNIVMWTFDIRIKINIVLILNRMTIMKNQVGRLWQSSWCGTSQRGPGSDKDEEFAQVRRT